VPQPVEIAAGAFQLLPLDDHDAADLLPVLSDPEVSRWGPAAPPRTLTDVQDWVGQRLAEVERGSTLAWTIRTAVGGLLAGHINLFNLDHEHGTAEVGFFVAPGHRRQGVARTGLSVVSRYAFTALDVRRIVLIHAVENTASCGVASASGYALEGITRSSSVLHGERVDEHLHARLATDPAASS
jgi:RimJ/RimL family protein N-acetyltransferase